jgi:hypothetical protein
MTPHSANKGARYRRKKCRRPARRTPNVPSQFGDMQRADAQSESGTFAGIKGSKALVRFQDAGAAVQIEVSDLGNVGGLAALTDAAANFAESEDQLTSANYAAWHRRRNER